MCVSALRSTINRSPQDEPIDLLAWGGLRSLASDRPSSVCSQTHARALTYRVVEAREKHGDQGAGEVKAQVQRRRGTRSGMPCCEEEEHCEPGGVAWGGAKGVSDDGIRDRASAHDCGRTGVGWLGWHRRRRNAQRTHPLNMQSLHVRARPASTRAAVVKTVARDSPGSASHVSPSGPGRRVSTRAGARRAHRIDCSTKDSRAAARSLPRRAIANAAAHMKVISARSFSRAPPA